MIYVVTLLPEIISDITENERLIRYWSYRLLKNVGWLMLVQIPILGLLFRRRGLVVVATRGGVEFESPKKQWEWVVLSIAKFFVGCIVLGGSSSQVLLEFWESFAFELVWIAKIVGLLLVSLVSGYLTFREFKFLFLARPELVSNKGRNDLTNG